MAKIYNVADFNGDGITKKMRYMRKVEVFPGEDGKWYWRCVASNGRIVAVGAEAFASAQSAWSSAVKALVGQPLIMQRFDEHETVQYEQFIPAH